MIDLASERSRQASPRAIELSHLQSLFYRRWNLLKKINKYYFLNIEKIVQIFSYIQNVSKTTSKLNLIKYLFFADRIHIRQYFSFISLDNYVALKYGPVASSSLDILNKSKDHLSNFAYDELKFLNNIKMINQSKRIIEPIGTDLLSNNEKHSIDSAVHIFGGKPLVELSHDYPEWKRYKELFDNQWISIHPIDIDDFFKNPDMNDSPCLQKYFNDVDPLYKSPDYLNEAKEFYKESAGNV
jgi:hypothetical protein